MIIVYILLLCFLVVCLYLISKTTSRLTKKPVTKFFKFEYPIQFQSEAPNPFDITNPFECDETHLKACQLDNPLSCAGCQNLIAQCVHFEMDVTLLRSDGSKHVIEKNVTPNDGYCLALKRAAETCNPYHGNLVLVKSDTLAGESVMFCICKNAGIIGNTQLNGACDTIFACNGKVANINTPIDKLACICDDPLTTPNNLNGTPVCVDTIVADQDLSKLDSSQLTVSIDRFDPSIVGSLKNATNLRDPCQYCAITGQHVWGRMVPSSDGWQCVGSMSSLPIRLSSTGRILKGSAGPDGIISVKLHSIQLYGKYTQGDYYRTRVRFSRKENPHLFGGGDASDDLITMDMEKHQLLYPGSFTDADIDKGLAFIAWASSFSYDKYILQTNTGSLKFGNASTYTGWYRTEFPDGSISNGNLDNPPPLFFWGTGAWKEMQTLNPVVTIKTVNQRPQFIINPNLFRQNAVAKTLKTLGISFTNKGRDNIEMDLIQTDSNTFIENAKQLIPE